MIVWCVGEPIIANSDSDRHRSAGLLGRPGMMRPLGTGKQKRKEEKKRSPTIKEMSALSWCSSWRRPGQGGGIDRALLEKRRMGEIVKCIWPKHPTNSTLVPPFVNYSSQKTPASNPHCHLSGSDTASNPIPREWEWVAVTNPTL